MSKMMTLMKAQMNNLIPINEIKERGSKKTNVHCYLFFWNTDFVSICCSI